MYERIQNISIIALFHGCCIRAEFALALACDFRLAADNLEIGDHRVTRAICMMSGASWFLPRLIGFGKATDLIMTGRHLDAHEALEIGLVNKIYQLEILTHKQWNMSKILLLCLPER